MLSASIATAGVVPCLSDDGVCRDSFPIIELILVLAALVFWAGSVISKENPLWPFLSVFGGLGLLAVINATRTFGQLVGWILLMASAWVVWARSQSDHQISDGDGDTPRTSNKAESSLITLNKVAPSPYSETENPKSGDQLYAEALNCFPSNEGKAALLMRTAAIKGHSKAHYYYGHWFLHGWGLEKDYSMAAHWLRKAADQGIHEALYDLGRMHFEGKGFPQSASQATTYWNQASAQGNPEAQYALSKLGISSIRPYTNIVRQTEGGSFAQCPKCAAEFNPAVFKECPVCGYILDDKSIGLP